MRRVTETAERAVSARAMIQWQRVQKKRVGGCVSERLTYRGGLDAGRRVDGGGSGQNKIENASLAN